jgi:hypothetical protein
MSDLTPVIETMEHRWMRAWGQPGGQGAERPDREGLHPAHRGEAVGDPDRPSWLEAAGSRWDCSSYRFGDLVVRDLGGVGVRGAARA